MTEFPAAGGSGIVMNVNTGEVLALVSLPDFDPNDPGATPTENLFNRVTLGTYEIGSVFKIFTVAMALDDHVTSLAGGYDASHPIKIDRFTMHVGADRAAEPLALGARDLHVLVEYRRGNWRSMSAPTRLANSSASSAC